MRFARPAQQDLKEIYAYISRDNSVAASKVVDRILDRAFALANNPYVGRNSDHPGIRVALVTGLRYLIFYTVSTEEVQVLHIRHTARKPWKGVGSRS